MYNITPHVVPYTGHLKSEAEAEEEERELLSLSHWDLMRACVPAATWEGKADSKVRVAMIPLQLSPKEGVPTTEPRETTVQAESADDSTKARNYLPLSGWVPWEQSEAEDEVFGSLGK